MNLENWRERERGRNLLGIIRKDEVKGKLANMMVTQALNGDNIEGYCGLRR